MNGTVKVIRLEDDGREISLYYIKAGESSIMSFLGGLHNKTGKVKAEVEEDAKILFEPGTARVVVSRLLKQLEDSGIVLPGRNKIVLV